jgi:hypothetical protein
MTSQCRRVSHDDVDLNAGSVSPLSIAVALASTDIMKLLLGKARVRCLVSDTDRVARGVLLDPAMLLGLKPTICV